VLGALLAVHEPEDADDQREEGDEREEDLVRDRAGEERPIVVEERREDPARGYDDVLSPFGAAAAGASDFAVSVFAGFAAFAGSLDASPVVEGASFACDASPASLDFGRLSVLYQPPPLKTIAGVAISLRGRLPQLGHFSSVASVYDWTCENV
jgi:hypothetical protein